MLGKYTTNCALFSAKHIIDNCRGTHVIVSATIWYINELVLCFLHAFPVPSIEVTNVNVIKPVSWETSR